MAQSLRFGRRLAIPSTRQIIHEMRMLQAEEERAKAALVPPAEVGSSTEHDLHRLPQEQFSGV